MGNGKISLNANGNNRVGKESLEIQNRGKYIKSEQKK